MTIVTNSKRYKFEYDEQTQVLRLIDNEKTDPLIKEKISGEWKLSEFNEYITNLKKQLNIN